MALMGVRKALLSSPVTRGPIAVVSSTSTDGDGTYNTTQIHNLPSSIVAGNLLLLIIFNGNGIAGALTTPAGWTSLTAAFGHGSGVCRFNIFYKTASGSEGATLTVDSAVASHQVSTAYQIRRAGTISIETALASGDPPVSDTVAATTNLFIAGSGGDAGTIGCAYTAAPTNYSNFLEGTFSPSSNSQCPNMGTAERLLTAASDDPGTFTTTGTVSNQCSFTIVIEPA
jgi:hypothetical protein